MASGEWNLIDQTKFEFKDSYCAFLDILGYKEKVELFFSDHLNLYGRIMRAMEHAGVERNPHETPDGIVTRIFSDSIILSVDKTNENLYLLLNFIGQMTAWFSYESLFLRGGLSFGKYYEDIKPNSNYSFLASEGLINSYRIEQSAKFPMIVVDDSILKEHPDNYWNGLIIKSNSKFIVNYAKYIINKKANNQEHVVAEINEIIDIRDKMKDESIVEKYDWIINYYLWYINQSQLYYGQFDMDAFKKFDKERKDKYQFEYF